MMTSFIMILPNRARSKEYINIRGKLFCSGQKTRENPRSKGVLINFTSFFPSQLVHYSSLPSLTMSPFTRSLGTISMLETINL